ncbi:MAG: ATP-grasp domain-containing protein [Flavobacterium sp.]|nr:MAG: ATP-grasp domain-containing protein [Flavobacterium sp.]
MKKLAILGATYLQMPLVEKAQQMGIEVHCFAWLNEDAVCRDVADYFYDISVLDKEKILEKCRDIKIDGITTIATDICIPTICYVAESLKLVSNSFESSLYCTNKAEMRRRFEKFSVQSPSFRKIGDDSELPAEIDFPVIVKPTDRSGSRGVAKVYTREALADAVQEAISESIEHKCVVEQFIDGSEVSVEGISWNGEHRILAITDKITTGEPHFVELEHHQPSELPDAVQDSIKRETLKALDGLDIKYGASHAECKITADGKVYLIEVGARMGGDFIGSHLVENSTGFDFLKAVILVALNEFEFDDDSLQPACSGVYFLSAETARLLPYFDRVNPFEIQKERRAGELKYIKNSNDRSGYLIYKSARRVKL